jgi:hypothetical protein
VIVLTGFDESRKIGKSLLLRKEPLKRFSKANKHIQPYSRMLPTSGKRKINHLPTNNTGLVHQMTKEER